MSGVSREEGMATRRCPNHYIDYGTHDHEERCQKRVGHAGPCGESKNVVAEAARADTLSLAIQVAKEVGGEFWETHRLNTGLLKFIGRLKETQSGNLAAPSVESAATADAKKDHVCKPSCHNPCLLND